MISWSQFSYQRLLCWVGCNFFKVKMDQVKLFFQKLVHYLAGKPASAAYLTDPPPSSTPVRVHPCSVVSFLPTPSPSRFSCSIFPGECSYPPDVTTQVTEGGRQAERSWDKVKRKLALGKVKIISDPTARDREDPHCIFPLCTIPSRDVNQGLTTRQRFTDRVWRSCGLSPQQSLLSKQSHFVPNTWRCTRQEKRESCPADLSDHRVTCLTRVNQDTWGTKSVSTVWSFPANWREP